MKMITCIIKPKKMMALKEGLCEVGITGMTVTEVKGFGRQLGHKEIFRGVEYNIEFRTKLKIEIAVKEEEVDTIVDAIIKATQTGKVGDGKIFVSGIEEVVRIRTSERGLEAI